MNHILQIVVSIGLFISTYMHGMEKPPRSTKKDGIQGEQQSNLNSYLSVLPAALVQSIGPMFSTPGPEEGYSSQNRVIRPRDNGRDPMVESSNNMRRFTQIAGEQFGESSQDNASVMKFLEAQAAFLAAHPEEKTSFCPNIISAAAGLATHNAHLVLPEIVRQNLETFTNLTQVEKNNTAITCMRFSPNPEVLGMLLDAGVELNAKDSDAQFTLVRRAVEARSPQVLDLLLKRGASPDIPDKQGISPLMRAVNLGDLAAVRLLLNHNCLVNACDNQGRSALSFAARKADAAMINVLQENGAHIFATGRSGKKNPLLQAVRSGVPEILKKLLEGCILKLGQANTLEAYINQALIKAAQRGNLPMVQELMPSGSKNDFDPKRNPRPDLCLDEKNKYKTAITAALYAEHPEVALRLLEFARDRYYKGLSNLKKSRSYALALAVNKKIMNQADAPIYQQIIDIILSEDVDPMEITLCPSAAYLAASGGDALILKNLIEHAAMQDYLEYCKETSADITILRKIELKHAQKLLFLASQAGDATAIKMLLNYGAQPDKVDLQGNTPLHKAVLVADARNIGMITDLCVHPNNSVNTPNEMGNTPLHCALNNPHIKTKKRVVKILLRNGAQINLPNIQGNTPLILAVQLPATDIGIIRTILKYADPHVELELCNKKGETALFCAAAQGNYGVAEQLLKARANPNAKNNSGCSALSKAARNGSFEMTKLLIDYGANIEAFKDGMLREAAKRGRIAYMSLLLSKNPNINGHSSSNGDTPLHKAVKRNQIEAVRLLLKEGALRDIKNFNGKTPLECALEIRDRKINKIINALMS